MNVLVSLFLLSLHIGGKETSSYIQRTVRNNEYTFFCTVYNLDYCNDFSEMFEEVL